MSNSFIYFCIILNTFHHKHLGLRQLAQGYRGSNSEPFSGGQTTEAPTLPCLDSALLLCCPFLSVLLWYFLVFAVQRTQTALTAKQHFALNAVTDIISGVEIRNNDRKRTITTYCFIQRLHSTILHHVVRLFSRSSELYIAYFPDTHPGFSLNALRAGILRSVREHGAAICLNGVIRTGRRVNTGR